jgi:hypothetical protein
MANTNRQEEALEEVIRQLELAETGLDSASERRGFADARIDSYIATARTATRAALAIARAESSRLPGSSGREPEGQSREPLG